MTFFSTGSETADIFCFFSTGSATADFFYVFKVPAATNALASGTEMTTDAQGSRVVLSADGSDAKKVSDLVHQVAYLNTREFPSPGKRIVQLATTLQCRYVNNYHSLIHSKRNAQVPWEFLDRRSRNPI